MENFRNIGFGSIGKAVAKRGRRLFHERAGLRPLLHSKQAAAQNGAELVGISDIFKQSDLFPCTFRNRTDKNLVNAEAIYTKKQGVVLINTARGGLIDEDAALKALLSGKIAASGWTPSP
jgi:D-3-phosphoglycerate dehydrogenase